MYKDVGKNAGEEPLKTGEVSVGLSLLKDSSTWLVTVQTAVLALVTFVAGKDALTKFSHPGITRALVLLALLCFALSIVCATFVLQAIPNLRIRMSYHPDADGYVDPTPSRRDANVYNKPAFDWTYIPSPRLWKFTIPEHLLFILGIVLFAIAIGLEIPGVCRTQVFSFSVCNIWLLLVAIVILLLVVGAFLFLPLDKPRMSEEASLEQVILKVLDPYPAPQAVPVLEQVLERVKRDSGLQ